MIVDCKIKQYGRFDLMKKIKNISAVEEKEIKIIRNVKDLSADNFVITIKDKEYDSRKDASTKFYESLSLLKAGEETKIGEISGFDIIGTKDELWYKPAIYIKGIGKYKVREMSL